MGIAVTLRSCPGQAVRGLLQLFIVHYSIPHVLDMSVTVGDFTKDVSELSQNRDPLGLDMDAYDSQIDSYTTWRDNIVNTDNGKGYPRKNPHGVWQFQIIWR